MKLIIRPSIPRCRWLVDGWLFLLSIAACSWLVVRDLVGLGVL